MDGWIGEWMDDGRVPPQRIIKNVVAWAQQPDFSEEDGPDQGSIVKVKV